MSNNPARYVLDANAFIQAKRKFYGLDFCPGYWATLIWHQQQGRLCSIDKVQDEILRGADDRAAWVEQQFGAAAFADTPTPEVAAVYSQMLTWVMAQQHFHESARLEFQQVADGWLAAYAKVSGCILVTLEEYDPLRRNKVPLVNVCRAFDVETITPFDLLRRLDVKLDWQSPA
jgi:predicted nucleic acid-binding protein